MKVDQSLSPHLEQILKTLPKSPGVYQMKDKEKKVIYVGKAKNLKSRVTSYFDRTKDLTLAKRQMVGKIVDIELILCSTEVEALVLETNLIKHLTPKYNILMKDDKNLAYLKITNSPVPELVKTRMRLKDGGEYYGPYVAGVEQCVRALRRIFRIRNCRMKFEKVPSRKRDIVKSKQRSGSIIEDYNLNKSSVSIALESSTSGELRITDKAGKTIPCMDYYIGLCPAPCLLQEMTLEEHKKNILGVKEFLSGKSVDLFEKIEEEMREKAKSLEFEKAKELKETLGALKSLHERQNVRDIVEGDIDICILYEKYDKTYIALTEIRSSQIVGVFRHEVDMKADDRERLLSSFLMRQYVDQENIPDTLLLSEKIEDEAFVSFLESQKISVEYPQIGPKNELINFTRNQLREYAYKREMSTLENRILTREHMVQVLERLGYDAPKKGEIIFECYDISHTDGHFTYASRVSIVNGKPDPARYKKYKIKSLEDGQIDDFASHREVMMRRTREGLEFNNLPQLIIIDGGKGQLSSAISGIREGNWKYKKEKGLSRISGEDDIQNQYALADYREHEPSLSLEGMIQICSIAKREEEIFLPGKKDPITFEPGTPELMVLQKARDEAHRFSIGSNKQAHMKSMKKNILEQIPGIGPVTRKKILLRAGTIDGIKTLPLEELEKICTTLQIERLREHGLM